MKKIDICLRDYVSRLSGESLRFLIDKIRDRRSGELAEVIDFLSKSKDLDGCMSAAKGADEFYDIMDQVRDGAERELRRRCR